MTRRQFEGLVEKALRRLPKTFKAKIANIAVVVEDWADDETLTDLGIEPPDTLYGLYRGVDLTRRDSSYGNVLPDTITIYQGPIEEDCVDEAEMAELVRDTVVHELGHYFGLALGAIPARVTRLGPGARRRLHDSGIASTTLDYPFSLPMARWLASRFPADADVAWRRFHDEDRLDETLSLLATTAEGDAFSEGGMGWREWLRVAKGGRRLTDLQLLLEVFGRTGLPTEARDWLFESLGLPIQWRPRGPRSEEHTSELQSRGHLVCRLLL